MSLEAGVIFEGEPSERLSHHEAECFFAEQQTCLIVFLADSHVLTCCAGLSACTLTKPFTAQGQTK